MLLSASVLFSVSVFMSVSITGAALGSPRGNLHVVSQALWNSLSSQYNTKFQNQA